MGALSWEMGIWNLTLSVWDWPNFWATKNWSESLYAQKNAIQTQTNNNYFYTQTYLYSSDKLNFVKADLKPEVILQKINIKMAKNT